MLVGDKATMKAAILSILISFPLASCQHTNARIPPRSEDTCGAYRLSDFVGSASDEIVRNDIYRKLGLADLTEAEWAASDVQIRFVEDGEPILADYRANRINVMTSKSKEIYAISCG